MRVLIGGVPYGCNNIGDEAILLGQVALVRKAIPDASITIATRDPTQTAQPLGASRCPLLDQLDPRELDELLGRHQVYIWGGATGMSDYPEVASHLLLRAHRAGLRTIACGCGFGSRLNPVLYSVSSGRRSRLYAAVRRFSLGTLDPRRWDEALRAHRAHRAIRAATKRCDCIIMRDRESAERLRQLLGTAEVLVGADPALLIDPTPHTDPSFPNHILEFINRHAIRIGICLSAQGAIDRDQDVVRMLDRLLSEKDCGAVGIPMNPVTDLELMLRLRDRLRDPQRFLVIPGVRNPAIVAGIASMMHVLISSRLHLLVLGAISGTPMVGIDRGGKVSSFLETFGRTSTCSADAFDGEACFAAAMREISAGAAARRHIRAVAESQRATLNGDVVRWIAAAAVGSSAADAGAS